MEGRSDTKRCQKKGEVTVSPTIVSFRRKFLGVITRFYQYLSVFICGDFDLPQQVHRPLIYSGFRAEFRCRCNFVALDRKVSGTFLFAQRCFKSVGVKCAKRCKLTSSGDFGFFVRFFTTT